MKAHFRTNLDEAKSFVHRLNDLGCTGREHDSRDYAVGDMVQFWFDGMHSGFQLRVVAKTIDPTREYALIELHLPIGTQTIREWSEWMSSVARELAEEST